MEEKRVPASVYAEMTPNPATMKFVANKFLVGPDEQADYETMAETKGSSLLAEELFNFPFVKRVFIAANFVAVTKTDNIDWDFITMELRDYVREFVAQGKEAVSKLPEAKKEEIKESQPKKVIAESDYDDEIRNLLNEYVRPAVENDGGAIEYLGFENGKVSVVMKGACSGCPSSSQTLQGGILTLLKEHIPAVEEVVSYEG